MTHKEFLTLLFKNEIVADAQFARTHQVQNPTLYADAHDEAGAVARWMIFHLAAQIKNDYVSPSRALHHGLLGMSLRPNEIRKQWAQNGEEDLVFLLEGPRREAIRIWVHVKRALLSPPDAPRYSYEGYEGTQYGWTLRWLARGERDRNSPDAFFIHSIGNYGPPPAQLAP